MRRYGCVAAMGLLALAACNPQPPKTAQTPSAAPAAPHATPSALSLAISGRGTEKQPIRIVQSVNNRKQYELRARSYQGHGAAGSLKALFQNVNVTFNGKDGTTMNADAPRAHVDESANTVTLEGGVHARNSTGMTLACDNLVYYRKTETIQGTGHVVITDPNGMNATGSRFTSDLSLTHTTMQ